METTLSAPAVEWRELVRKAGTPEFAAAFAPEVYLDTTVLNATCFGAEKIGAFFDATRTMFDHLEFTREAVAGRRTYMEWVGQAFGLPIAGTTIVARNGAGLIESIRLFHQPLNSVARFSAELAKRLEGKLGKAMFATSPYTAFVREAFDALFNRRDYAAAEKFWSPNYIQHSAHIAPGRDGLFNLVKTLPPTLRYDSNLIMADGDFVIAHGRFSGHGRPANWVACDVLRIEGGLLAEHWDVLQDEATLASSVSGLPMFGDQFPG